MPGPRWVKMELNGFVTFLSGLSEVRDARTVRRIVKAELAALAAGDGAGDTFSAKLIREANKFMSQRARKAAEARWRTERQTKPALHVVERGAADGRLPMKEEAYDYAARHGLDTGLVASWYEWAATKDGMKSWKGSLTGFCRMKEGQWKKQGNQ